MIVIKKEFIDFVKARLEAKGWSLREMSRRSGINVATLSLYLNEKTTPLPEQMERILATLGAVAHLTFSDIEENVVDTFVRAVELVPSE